MFKIVQLKSEPIEFEYIRSNFFFADLFTNFNSLIQIIHTFPLDPMVRICITITSSVVFVKSLSFSIDLS